MALYRCLQCEKFEPNDETHNNENYITVTDDDRFNPNEKCAHCGRGGLVCEHQGSFDKAKQGFVCHQCDEEYGATGLCRLRLFAKTGVCPDLLEMVDVTDH